MRAQLPVAAIAVVVLLAACGSDDDAGTPGRVTVAAAFYPLEEIARAVGGDAVDVVTIVPPGEEAHEYEPTPKQLTSLGDADVVAFLGNDFQPNVEKALDNLPGSVQRLDLMAFVDAIPVAGGLGDGPTDVEESAIDPHVWLSPRNMQSMATAVADALAAASPADADAFQANAADYIAGLAALDTDLAAGLATCESPYLVTGHQAFGYLADAYGLTQVAIAGISPGEEPSAKTLEEVATFATEHDVTTIFFEENLPDDLSRTVADEIGATTAVLDPVESPSREQLDAGATYESLMRQNLAALRAGLRCE